MDDFDVALFENLPSLAMVWELINMYNRKYRKEIGHNKEAMNCENYQYYILLSKQCWHNNSYQMRIKACLYVVELPS